MELKELLDYIKEKHNIEESDRWDSFLTMSRLYHPLTGKMIALLIKEWNSDTGRWAEHCDLKYDASLFDRMKEYIVAPLRMHGSSWVGISFNDKTDRDITIKTLNDFIAPKYQIKLIEIIYLNYLIRQYYKGIRLKTQLYQITEKVILYIRIHLYHLQKGVIF